MKIGIDIDEVLCELVRGYCRFMEVKKGLKKNYEDVYCYNLWEVFGILRQEAFDVMEEFCRTEEFDNIGLIDGARDAVLELSKNHELYFITSRPESLKEKTESFISKNFGRGYKIIFSGELHGENKTKEAVCKDLGIGVMIEDDKKISERCARGGIKVFLLDKPWNKKFEHENILRVQGWDEILLGVKNATN